MSKIWWVRAYVWRGFIVPNPMSLPYFEVAVWSKKWEVRSNNSHTKFQTPHTQSTIPIMGESAFLLLSCSFEVKWQLPYSNTKYQSWHSHLIINDEALALSLLQLWASKSAIGALSAPTFFNCQKTPLLQVGIVQKQKIPMRCKTKMQWYDFEVKLTPMLQLLK